MDVNIEKEIEDIEERIIEWAKLIGNNTPGSGRLKTRIEMIDYLIQERKGLMGLLVKVGVI